ncbi:MAG: 30S ribosome-binding factor RbfA [Amoebophilaceae bacterium]|jgi:ribosome-binding factor A|nr:30S ribosome-binding factor RbfA [Amoebophilaceae bacterium]
MAQPIKIQKVARLLQKVLGEIFVQETSKLLSNHVVTVTEVSMSPDLGLAKVYLSFIFSKGEFDMLAQVQQRKGVFRKLLGNRIGNKLRKVPELKFYIDNSAAHAAKMHKLLSGLDMPEYSDGAV